MPATETGWKFFSVMFGRRPKRANLMRAAVVSLGTLIAPIAADADDIGSVDTKFKLIGPDHKIVIEAFDDPDVEGVSCHLSRAKTGGVSGALGIAEDTSDAAIACRQVGPVRFTDEMDKGERVFAERRSFIFKTLQVVRFCDEVRNTLVYLVYSDKLIEGSPKNSISTVPILPWPVEGGFVPAPQCNDED